MTRDELFMTYALKEAKKALLKDEVPIGAIIVKDGKIIARGHNIKEKTNQATDHAEIIALRKASKKLGTWRLTGCDLFVTIEPCLMCSGAIYQSRINRVIYGSKDLRAGALGSIYKINEDNRLNHNFAVVTGVLENECSELIKSFFKTKR